MTDNAPNGATYEFSSPDAEAAWAAFDAQGRIEPGTEGWWPIWGAQPRHARAGDLVLAKAGDTYDVMLIEDVYTAKAAPLRLGWVLGGERQTIGALCPVQVLRRGTRNTLAEP